ncbi:head maturation protease, ClpP-related [Senegalia massiliensis]|uniref:head maturation protease, ClpP-related n=1 Tax=Senegalia massiliensis TaxID=1720316 RepID=UPI00102F7A8A|nr:head maturation protease, ClpP-related [Senegalia massiliensis]
MDIEKLMSQIKPRVEIKNEVESEYAEIYLYGTIREAYPWETEREDIISSSRVKKFLSEADGKKLKVYINSGGGDVFESIAIRNILKRHDNTVDIYIDALAGSGASVIATSGDNVYMYDNSMQMIHCAWTFAMGNSKELRKVADDLEKIDTSVHASYMNKFVGTEEELKDLLDDESWLTAEECKAFGFCTEILEDVEPKEEPKNNVKQNLFNKYNKKINNQKQTKVADKATLFNAFKKQEVVNNE